MHRGDGSRLPVRGVIANRTIDNSAAYISGWLLKKLRDDRKLIIHAAAHAQRASDYILNVKATEISCSYKHTLKRHQATAPKAVLLPGTAPKPRPSYTTHTTPTTPTPPPP